MFYFLLSVFIILFLSMVLLVFRITSLRENLRSREEEIKELQAENLRLNNLSMTDTLTGLMNRRAIESCILNAIHRHNRFHSEVSIMVLDLDHFKRINDCRGHDFGDKVLKIVADTIKGICRKTDYFARWGGEEFLILASGTSGANALTLAEKIRSGLEQSPLEELTGVTVSIGISSYRRGESFKEWFNRADEALYHAKERGRNLVVLAPEDIPLIKKEETVNEDALRLEWKHEYSAGIDDIDLRHRDIFHYSNKILDSVLHHSDADFLESSLNEMFRQVKAHFKAEEKILKKMKYSGLEDHMEEHNKLISQFKELIDLHRQKEAEPIRLLNYISQDLIYKHMILKDREYSHLNKRVSA